MVTVPLALSWALDEPDLAAVVTALGEELIFRGLLLVLAVAVGWDNFSFLSVSIGFGV